MKRITWILIVCLCALILGSHTHAQSIDGTVYSDNLTIKDQSFTIKGTALLRYMVFIKAYTGALYLPENTPKSSTLLADVPKHLVLEYRVSIKAEDFATATRLYMEKNVDPQTFEKLSAKIETLNSLYQDVKADDRYALTYIPGYGTSLSLNGRQLGKIEGKDFAFALFSVWLGDHPIDTSFKNTLMRDS